MDDGWYLMDTETLERVLSQWRAGVEPVLPEGAVALSIADALAFRNAGNLPDRFGRTLRLVLHATDEDVEQLSTRRLEFEPDVHAAPTWRREGSKPVNVVPLRRRTGDAGDVAWWERTDVRELEEVWRRTGEIEGISVPAAYRGFVFKTVLALRAAGRDVTVDAIADSVARWLSPDEVEGLRKVLGKAKEPDQ